MVQCYFAQQPRRPGFRREETNHPIEVSIIIFFTMVWTDVVSWFQPESRNLQSGRIDLVDLRNFDVQIAVTEEINSFQVLDIVTAWMNDGFEEQLETLGLNSDAYADFTMVYLLERSSKRNLRALQQEEPMIRTIPIKGAAIFSRLPNQTIVPQQLVHEIQGLTMADPTDLQLALRENFGGVVDARAVFTASPGGSSKNDSLEIVIIVAIVVACLAFCLLIVAILLAWRTDRRNRSAYRVDTPQTKDTTANTSEYEFREAPPPVENVQQVDYAVSEIDDSVAEQEGIYAESMISDDISTSLSQYYRSGMATNGVPDNYRLNDAASMSSMDSYGYSLDGAGMTTTGKTIESTVPMMDDPPGNVSMEDEEDGAEKEP